MGIKSNEFHEIKEVAESLVDTVFCDDNIVDKITTSREFIVLKTLDRLVRRVFFLVVNMSDKDFEKYVEIQRQQMRMQQNKKDYELTELFFDLLECKRREFKILQKLERVER